MRASAGLREREAYASTVGPVVRQPENHKDARRLRARRPSPGRHILWRHSRSEARSRGGVEDRRSSIPSRCAARRRSWALDASAAPRRFGCDEWSEVGACGGQACATGTMPPA